MKWSTFMLVALLPGILIGCNDYNRANSKDFVQKEDLSYASDTTLLPTSKNEAQEQENEKPNDDWEKKIIKTASLTIEAKNYNGYYTAMYETVKRVGGYISQEAQSQTEYKMENIVTIKVPVTQFHETLSLLAMVAGNSTVIEKKISSEDVTGEVVDTKSRLEAKRQVRLRYLELLKQAKNMEEVLRVQSEINELQEQIEMANGRLLFLNRSAAFSTINLTFFQVLNPSAGIVKEPTFYIKLVNAFESGWNFITLLMLGLVSIWPVLLLVAILWLACKKRQPAKSRAAQ